MGEGKWGRRKMKHNSQGRRKSSYPWVSKTRCTSMKSWAGRIGVRRSRKNGKRRKYEP